MSEDNILYSKEGFIFYKIEEKNYKMVFNIENDYIDLSKIIDFNMIKLIYELNPDIYEKINIEIINDNHAIFASLFKHFCQDLGLPQNYSFIDMKMIREENKITIKSKTIYSHKPDFVSDDVELMKMDDFTSTCNIITPHKIFFVFNILFNSDADIPKFAEKIAGIILFKIFKRLKLFIENVRI